MKRLLGLGIACYLIFLVLSFPATLAQRWLAPEDLQLAGVRGSLWSGSASAARYTTLGFAELRWRARPWALLAGRLSYRLSATGPLGPFEAVVGVTPLAKLYISDLTGRLPLDTLSGLLPADVPVDMFSGEIQLDLADLVLVDGWPARAIGTVNVNELLLEATAAEPLGSYEVLFSGEGADEELRGAFRDTGGPLALQGTVTLRPDRSYTLQCQASARGGASQNLRATIDFLCPPNPGG